MVVQQRSQWADQSSGTRPVVWLIIWQIIWPILWPIFWPAVFWLLLAVAHDNHRALPFAPKLHVLGLTMLQNFIT